MAGNKKPRKKYKPKRILIDAMSYAKLGASTIRGKAFDAVCENEWKALDALRTGNGTANDWQTIVDCNNVAQTMAGKRIGRQEVMPICHAVEQELIQSAIRFGRTKRWGLTGPGIQKIKDLIEYHVLQRTAVARSQYEEAIRLTTERIKNGHGTIDLNKTLELYK